MDRRLLKRLWLLRFRKMMSLEQKSARDYEELLEECRRTHRGQSMIGHLEALLSDERKHIRLVEELLELLKRQKV